MMTNIWDETYQNPEYVYGKSPNKFLADLSLKAEGKKKVLCLAEGEGRNAVYLAKSGFDVLAVDQSETGLKKAMELSHEQNTEIWVERADLGDYLIPSETYDGVVSIFGHFNPQTRTHIHREVMHGRKKGGFFVLEAYSKEQIAFNTGGPKNLELLYSLPELESDFADNLVYSVKREIQREVVEGKLHTGMASVIQIFGFKK